MKLFKCQHCGQLVYFENDHCETCGHRLGFLAVETSLSALEPDGAGWIALAADAADRFRFCANAGLGACNWLIPEPSDEALCVACRHNLIIPDISLPENLPHWQKLESAIHCCAWACRSPTAPTIRPTAWGSSSWPWRPRRPR